MELVCNPKFESAGAVCYSEDTFSCKLALEVQFSETSWKPAWGPSWKPFVSYIAVGAHHAPVGCTGLGCVGAGWWLLRRDPIAFSVRQAAGGWVF